MLVSVMNDGKVSLAPFMTKNTATQLVMDASAPMLQIVTCVPKTHTETIKENAYANLAGVNLTAPIGLVFVMRGVWTAQDLEMSIVFHVSNTESCKTVLAAVAKDGQDQSVVTLRESVIPGAMDVMDQVILNVSTV